MRKIVKLKKGEIEISSSFLFEIILGIMLIIILFSYVKTVDSGMVYWREYYAKDLSLTFSMLEAIPNDVSVNYIVLHDSSMIKTQPVRLGLKLFKGKLSLFNRENPHYETTEYYVTKESSTINIDSPLEALTIRKDDGSIEVISQSAMPCTKYALKKKEFLLTSIKMVQLDSSRLTSSITNYFVDSIEEIYVKQLPGEGIKESLRNTLYNKNIIDPNTEKDIIILFDHEKADAESIIIKYASKGNMKLAANLACQIYSDMKEYYGDNPKIYVENLPSNNINYNFETDTAVVLIQFRSEKSADDFSMSSSLFADTLIESIQSLSINTFNNKFIEDLLSYYGLNG